MSPQKRSELSSALSRRSMLKTTAVGAVGVPALAATTASAEAELVEKVTVELGETTVTFDAVFLDDDYSVGDTLTITVDWEVEDGDATYVDFVQSELGYTPSGADGTEPEVVEQSEGAVTAEFEFTALEEFAFGWAVGNAHFGLVLEVEVADGVTEEVPLVVTVTGLERGWLPFGAPSDDLVANAPEDVVLERPDEPEITPPENGDRDSR